MMSDHSDAQMHDLHTAVRDNQIERVTALLDSGIDVNALDAAKNTALHIASELGYVDVVRVLLQAPTINTTIKNDNEQTPVQIANAKEAEYRVTQRKLMELPENKDKPLFKSNSNFYVISQMLLQHKKSHAVATKVESETANAKSDEDKPHNPFIKLIRKITRVDVNLGLMSPLDVLKYAINENYSTARRGESLGSINPELSRIQNPLFFVNSGLSLLNIGIRVLVDKISNKITGNALSKPVATTVIKAVLTTPISLVQLIVGGVAESLNWVGRFIGEKIADKFAVKHSKNTDDKAAPKALAHAKLVQDASVSTPMFTQVKSNGIKAFFESRKDRGQVKSRRESLAIEMSEIDPLRPKQ